jgi:AAA+ superfamily predicted ATPase
MPSVVNYTLQRQSENLAIVAAACSLRRYLRQLLKHKDIHFAVMLHVPEPGDCFIYEEACRLLFNVDKDFDMEREVMTAVYGSSSFDTSPQALIANISAQRQTLICNDGRKPVNEDVRLVLDLEIEISPPSATHFLAASRSVTGFRLSEDDARFLAEHSLRSVRLATHRRRSMNRIRKVLSPVPDEMPEADPPEGNQEPITLDKLSGFGEAAKWGIELACDLADWREGRIDWDDIDKGVLLSGPPGVGKTMYARALANTCGVNLFLESAARWQSKGHLGDMLNEMRRAFAAAAKARPSIVFLDEFDSFGSRDIGDSGYSHDYKTQVINALLECLSPSEGREGVIVVGATNRPDAIDRALLRPGRLEKVITIPLPDAQARTAILRHHLGAADGIDMTSAVKHTDGWSGADLEKLARDAKRNARRRAGQTVTDADIRTAMPPVRLFTAEERFRVALHEVGHAITGTMLKVGNLTGIRIDAGPSNKSTRKSVGAASFDSLLPMQPLESDFEGLICMLLGGVVAERLVLGGHSAGAGGDPSSDLPRVTAIATMMENMFGYGDHMLADATESTALTNFSALPPNVGLAVKARVDRCYQQTMGLLEPRTHVLVTVANTLMEEEEMTAARFLEVASEAERTHEDGTSRTAVSR